MHGRVLISHTEASVAVIPMSPITVVVVVLSACRPAEAVFEGTVVFLEAEPVG